MTCPSCGSQLPDGTDFCPNCGSVIPSDGFNNTGNAYQQMPNTYPNNGVYNGPDNNPYGNMPQAPKKKLPTAAIAAIVLVIIAAIGVGAFFIVKAIKNQDDKNAVTKAYAGTYVLDSVTITYMGESMTYSSSDMGLNGDDMQIVVGNKGDVTLISDGQQGTGNISFKGDSVEISDSGATIKGTYNMEQKTITIPFAEFLKYISSADLSAEDQQTLEMLNMFDEMNVIFKKK
ncbi:MAG: zinc-ribbon domain-containing protein [Lachnospiraceae bacterium]|nr:zinc-ribbon domain-containing protein [Lachnospiraceae bacterium]